MGLCSSHITAMFVASAHHFLSTCIDTIIDLAHSTILRFILSAILYCRVSLFVDELAAIVGSLSLNLSFN